MQIPTRNRCSRINIHPVTKVVNLAKAESVFSNKGSACGSLCCRSCHSLVRLGRDFDSSMKAGHGRDIQLHFLAVGPAKGCFRPCTYSLNPCRTPPLPLSSGQPNSGLQSKKLSTVRSICDGRHRATSLAITSSLQRKRRAL